MRVMGRPPQLPLPPPPSTLPGDRCVLKIGERGMVYGVWRIMYGE